MVIRKADGTPNVSKTQAKPVQQPAADPLVALKGKVDHALKNGILSAEEATDLSKAIKANPQQKDAITAYLRDQLAQHPDATVRDRAQKSVGKALGIDPKELFFEQQAHSTTTSAPVTAGLEKTARNVDEEHDAEAQRKASDARLEKQKALLESHGAEKAQRPIGGVKGAAYDAGADARKILAEHVEAKVVGKMGVETRAAYGELRAPVLKTGQAVVEEMKRTGTATKIAGVASEIGKPGFKEALSTAAGSVSKDIVSATNMTAVNTEAVAAAVQGTHSVVSALTNVTKGTALESVVATHGAKLTAGATQLAAKLGATATAAEGAAGAAKAATGVAAGAAEAGGQAVPVLGQALGVVTTGLATAEFIGHCRNKPKDWKRIIANGANVVAQAVGIFIPFVGAAGTAGKLAADAAMNAHDKKLGKETAQVGLKDLNGHIQNASGLVTPFLEGAGYGDAAAKMKEYTAKVNELAEKGVSSTDLAKIDAAERDAMIQQLGAAQQELEKAAPDAKGTPNEAASLLLGQALSGLLAAFRKQKNVATSADPEGEKKKLDGDAMEAAGKAAVAQTMAAADAHNV